MGISLLTIILILISFFCFRFFKINNLFEISFLNTPKVEFKNESVLYLKNLIEEHILNNRFIQYGGGEVINHEDYKEMFSHLNDLDDNISFYKKVESKVEQEFDKFYKPIISSNIYQSKDIKKFNLENFIEIFGIDKGVWYLSTFQTKVKSEFLKCQFSLYGIPLKMITTDKFHLLINELGFIYLELEEPYHNNKIFKIRLTFPIEYFNHLNFQFSDSNFEISLNIRFYRKVLERVNSISLFEELVNKILNFNNLYLSKKIDTDKFWENVIKENVILDFYELVKLKHRIKILSLNEYLINVEMGNLDFDIHYVFDLIYIKQNIGSFYSKEKTKLIITKTSFKIISIEELKKYYLKYYSDKNIFLKSLGIDKFYKKIDFRKLNDEEKYRNLFDYSTYLNLENGDDEWFESQLSKRGFFIKSEKKKLLKKGFYKKFEDIDLNDLVKLDVRRIENKLRLKKGFNIVGTLISENILFVKLSRHFKSVKVVSQGKPKWLGRQSLDVFFPDYNIGIEYQGVQHFKPVDFYGGDEKFIKQQQLDNLKRELCLLNGCRLIEVEEGYDFQQLVKNIRKIIKETKSIN
jgi:hypothetical protein